MNPFKSLAKFLSQPKEKILYSKCLVYGTPEQAGIPEGPDVNYFKNCKIGTLVADEPAQVEPQKPAEGSRPCHCGGWLEPVNTNQFEITTFNDYLLDGNRVYLNETEWKCTDCDTHFPSHTRESISRYSNHKTEETQ